MGAVQSGRLADDLAEEQADDAAALLAALGAAPAVAFGTSSGANFALCLLVRHPDAARGAILHEPALFAFHDDLDAVRAPLKALLADAMAEDGPAAAIEPFWRYVAGDNGWITLAPALRERMRASAGTLFGTELGTYERYLPDDEKLRGVAQRVRLLVSADGLPVYQRGGSATRRASGPRRRDHRGHARGVSRSSPGAGRGRPPALARADPAQCLARSCWRHMAGLDATPTPTHAERAPDRPPHPPAARVWQSRRHRAALGGVPCRAAVPGTLLL